MANKNEQLGHIESWRYSGLSKKVYAEQNGIKIGTFYSWFKSQGPEENSFVEVGIDGKEENQSRGKQTKIILSLPKGYRIFLSKAYDQAVLTELLDLLEAR